MKPNLQGTEMRLPTIRLLHMTYPLCAILLLGCASKVDPTPAIEAARAALNEANRNEAARYAPSQLGIAQGKFVLAEQEFKNKRPVVAQRLGEQAAVDARLAQVLAQSQRAQLAAKETNNAAATIRGNR